MKVFNVNQYKGICWSGRSRDGWFNLMKSTYERMFVLTCIHLNIHTYKHPHTHSHTHSHSHSHSHAHAHAHAHANTHKQSHKHTHTTHTHTRTHTHICTRTRKVTPLDSCTTLLLFRILYHCASQYHTYIKTIRYNTMSDGDDYLHI